MTNSSSQFVGDIPGVYDRCLGPNFFEHYAGVMAARAAACSPQDVLEQAAGTGIVSVALRAALRPHVALTVTDLNEPMLTLAQDKLSAAPATRFQPADALALPFDDDSFDLIVVQFGHMFFPDRAAAYAEARRVLRPGGTYLFATWGSLAENPAGLLAQQNYEEMFPENTPQFYHIPFSLNDPEAILAELRGAGFDQTAHEAVPHEHHITDIAEFAKGLTYGNPGYLEVMERGGDPEAIRANMEGKLRGAFGAEPAPMPLLAHFFSARMG